MKQKTNQPKEINSKMELLDIIKEMQDQGISNQGIFENLQRQGYKPTQINDAINQLKITIQPMDTQNQDQQNAFNQQQDFNQQPNFNQEQQYTENQQNYPQEDYYTQTPQAYSGEEYYQQPSFNTETITEITEQVISEKFREYNKRTGDIVSFKNTIQDKVDDINTRLKRIESTIDKLQQAIIQKIGEFGENTQIIKKDLESLHDTTSKLMNPLIDNYRELQKTNERKSSSTKKK
ncbi:MAG: hypothetical protein PHX15_01770 [Candidatus Nanoarchaeia archaeon]|nr:hypothetical protein [Candidatus Nanoarchaeia archaeon]MDD4563595.1 hypothetical protein [Candidatus Nanoarchaeia archaeon]